MRDASQAWFIDSETVPRAAQRSTADRHNAAGARRFVAAAAVGVGGFARQHDARATIVATSNQSGRGFFLVVRRGAQHLRLPR